MICPVCCGAKRKTEIQCFPSCEYLRQGEEYQRTRTISELATSSFTDKSHDIFKDEQVIEFIYPLELFFVQQFYGDWTVNDADIYDALAEIYSYRTGMIKELRPANRCQELIFMKFNEINQKTPKIEEELKTKAILRVLKSIKDSSGGVLGHRNYLEMIYSQSHSDGTWNHLFRDKSD